MRIKPITNWKRPRFTYNLIVNGKQVVVNNKSVVVYWKEQNVNTRWNWLWKRDEIFTWNYDYYPWLVSNFPWSWIVKNTLRRPRFQYNLIVNWKQLVVNGKDVIVYGKEQNVKNKWR